MSNGRLCFSHGAVPLGERYPTLRFAALQSVQAYNSTSPKEIQIIAIPRPFRLNA